MIAREEVLRLTRKYEIGNQPGYLSYPAVSKWRHSLSATEVQEACASLVEDSYLYFHFPYCETLCWYCSCYMRITSDPDSKYDQYLAALEREIELKLAPPSARRTVGEMHWGGGTPTYMSCAQIERAFRAIERQVTWAPSATLSIEAYPDERTLSEEKLRLLRDLGFSQLSFGVESLDPKVLQAINRRHDLSSIRRWVELARGLGFGVHIDLVYGLPHQTTDSLGQTLRDLASVAPDRLATFPFLFTPFEIEHQAVIPRASVPGAVDRFYLYETLSSVEQLGYQRVGGDHWVRAGDPLFAAAARGEVVYHFQGYEPMSRKAFLGFGSSAISFVGDLYFQNQLDIGRYAQTVAGGGLPFIADRCAALDADDRARHFVIMKQVMSDLRIDKARFEERFGARFDEHFGEELVRLREMQADGLLVGVDERAIDVTPLGRTFLRSVAQVFDRYIGARGHRGLPLVG